MYIMVLNFAFLDHENNRERTTNNILVFKIAVFPLFFYTGLKYLYRL